MRLNWILVAAMLYSITLTGCETMRGAAEGFGQDVENTASNVPDFWAKLKEADAWMQKHLW